MMNITDSKEENKFQIDPRTLDEIIAEAGKNSNTTAPTDGDVDPPEHNLDEPPHYPNNNEDLGR